MTVEHTTYWLDNPNHSITVTWDDFEGEITEIKVLEVWGDWQFDLAEDAVPMRLSIGGIDKRSLVQGAKISQFNLKKRIGRVLVDHPTFVTIISALERPEASVTIETEIEGDSGKIKRLEVAAKRESRRRIERF